MHTTNMELIGSVAWKVLQIVYAAPDPFKSVVTAEMMDLVPWAITASIHAFASIEKCSNNVEVELLVSSDKRFSKWAKEAKRFEMRLIFLEQVLGKYPPAIDPRKNQPNAKQEIQEIAAFVGRAARDLEEDLSPTISKKEIRTALSLTPNDLRNWLTPEKSVPLTEQRVRLVKQNIAKCDWKRIAAFKNWTDS